MDLEMGGTPEPIRSAAPDPGDQLEDGVHSSGSIGFRK